MQAIDMNQIIEEVATENGFHPEAFAAYIDNENLDIDEAIQAFSDHHAGVYDSVEAWAEEYAEETGLLDSVPDNLRYYFDMEMWARDRMLEGSIWTADIPDGIAIFWS